MMQIAGVTLSSVPQGLQAGSDPSLVVSDFSCLFEQALEGGARLEQGPGLLVTGFGLLSGLIAPREGTAAQETYPLSEERSIPSDEKVQSESVADPPSLALLVPILAPHIVTLEEPQTGLEAADQPAVPPPPGPAGALGIEIERPQAGWRLDHLGDPSRPTGADAAPPPAAPPAERPGVVPPPAGVGPDVRSRFLLLSADSKLSEVSLIPAQAALTPGGGALIDSSQPVSEGYSRMPVDAAGRKSGEGVGIGGWSKGVAGLPVPHNAGSGSGQGSLEAASGTPAMASDAVEVAGPRAAEIIQSPDRSPGGPTSGDEAPMRHRSRALGAPQGVPFERPPSVSDNENRSLDLMAHPPGGSRQSSPATVGLGGLRPEESRSGAVTLPERSRSLLDQVAHEIARAARLGVRSEDARVQVRLRPEALGELVIQVSWNEKGIVAAIQAASRLAGEMLEGDLGHLRNALDLQGIPVSSLAVQIGLDFRDWGAGGERFRAPSTIGFESEASPWRDRGSAQPVAEPIERQGLIDITI